MKRSNRYEDGFTLIELLVVILIIGILAAIALPSFLNQKQKGQDASAKSDVRNAVSLMESCYVDTRDYSDARCSSATIISPASGLVEGGGAGQVQISDSAPDSFTASSLSHSGSYFNVTRDNSGLHRCKASAATTICSTNDW